jgi:hypothetical protein
MALPSSTSPSPHFLQRTDMTTADERQAAQPNGDNSALQPAQLRELREYRLPTDRLKRKLDEKDKGRIPLVLCACGSFSPITYCMLF